jgi:hypothetical protein
VIFGQRRDVRFVAIAINKDGVLIFRVRRRFYLPSK